MVLNNIKFEGNQTKILTSKPIQNLLNVEFSNYKAKKFLTLKRMFLTNKEFSKYEYFTFYSEFHK